MFHGSAMRKRLNFDNASEEEQNRFFNEFMVSYFVMLLLLVEKRRQLIEEPYEREYLRVLREALPKCYVAWIASLGIAKENVETWRKVVDLRYDEYAKDQYEWRSMMFEHRPNISEYPEVIMFQTISFGLYYHLRKGKTDTRDKLYNLIQDQMLPTFRDLYKKMSTFF